MVQGGELVFRVTSYNIQNIQSLTEKLQTTPKNWKVCPFTEKKRN
jgi:hypothetical protein